MTTYQHGGDIVAFAKSCDCEVEEVIDLSSNINFVKPQLDVDFNALDIAPYPNYDALYEAVALHYSVKMEEMEIFNGGSSAIFALFQYIRNEYANSKGRHMGLPLRCVVYSPAYLEYKKAAEVFEYALQTIDRFEHLDAEVHEGSLVVFVNPSTPDGMFYDVEALLQMWREKHCTVLIDESFIEFTPFTSVTKLLSHYPNLYILKSMTKFFGAAGIRVGTLLSQKQNIEALKRTEPLWKLSAYDSAYIQSVLKDKGFKKRSDLANAQSKDYLLALLKQSPMVKTIYPSEANYLLIELKNITAQALQEKLLPHRVMIRSCENFDGLGVHHVRIAIKSIEALSLLKEVLHA